MAKMLLRGAVCLVLAAVVIDAAFVSPHCGDGRLFGASMPQNKHANVRGSARRGGFALGASMMAQGDKPLRIGVIGAGPGGLSTALALQKYLPESEVKVFERKEGNIPNIGGGLQVNGGAAALASLGLEEEIAKAGTSLKRVTSNKVGGGTLVDLDVDTLLRSRAKDTLVSKKSGDLYAYMIMRDALNDIIASPLLPGTVEHNKRLDKVTELPSGEVECAFADGERATFDLLVGCDGVSSVVRKHVVGPDNAFYSGIRCRFAVASNEGGAELRRPSESGTVEQWFGDGCYAFLGTYGGIKGEGQYHAVILVEEDRALSFGENADYAPSSDTSREAMVADMRAKGLPDSLIGVVGAADRTFETGVHVHNPLVRWSKGRCVLLGDAAHAMPPFLGQGANQSIQDALCLAQQLAKVGGGGGRSVAEALAAYEGKRRLHTTKLAVNSWIIGALETRAGPGAAFRNGFFQTMAKVGVLERVFVDGAVPCGVEL